MEARLFRITAFHPVNDREVTMRVHHLRLKAEGRFPRERGAFGIAGASQRDAEIEMSHRQAMQETYGTERTVDSLLVLTQAPISSRKSEKSTRVIFVQGERFFE